MDVEIEVNIRIDGARKYFRVEVALDGDTRHVIVPVVAMDRVIDLMIEAIGDAEAIASFSSGSVH